MRHNLCRDRAVEYGDRDVICRRLRALLTPIAPLETPGHVLGLVLVLLIRIKLDTSQGQPRLK